MNKKDWMDRPFGPNAGETLADYEARLATYAAANPTLVTPLNAAALEDLETRTETAIAAGSGGPITVSDGTANAAAHQFTLSPRTDAALTFAVPTVRSTTVNSQTAFDVMPNGTATPASNGYAWMDVCDTDGLVGTFVGSTARVGIHSDHVEFSSRGFGATAKRIDMSANMINNNQIPQFQINPGNSTLSSNFPTAPGNIQIGKDGSDVYLGRIASTLAAAATTGYTYLRMVTAPPTGVPSGVLSGSAAIAVDSTGKIWVYTSANAAWKGVATA